MQHQNCINPFIQWDYQHLLHISTDTSIWRTIIKSFAIRPNTRHSTSREDVTGSSTGKKLTKNTHLLLLYGPGPDYFTREHSIRCAKVLLHVVGTDQRPDTSQADRFFAMYRGIMWDHEKRQINGTDTSTGTRGPANVSCVIESSSRGRVIVGQSGWVEVAREE